jgi:hypothetical protein
MAKKKKKKKNFKKKNGLAKIANLTTKSLSSAFQIIKKIKN